MMARFVLSQCTLCGENEKVQYTQTVIKQMFLKQILTSALFQIISNSQYVICSWLGRNSSANETWNTEKYRNII